jgi:hypothetical protein
MVWDMENGVSEYSKDLTKYATTHILRLGFGGSSRKVEFLKSLHV